MLKDHLGSASVVTDSSGNVVGEQRYYPFGGTRWSTGSMYTDKLFTGQREMEGLGVYHYQTRFYSPTLGRFLSADTIIPGAANPQAFNRYSYVTNNPIRYNDPSGHMLDSGGGNSCNDKIKKCSVTHTVLIGKHNQLPLYIPESDDSDCAGCSAEGQFAPHPAASIPGFVNGIAIYLRNNEAMNGKPDIFTFFTYEEYSDGTVSAKSITILNKSNKEISVKNVFFDAEPGICQDPSCKNMTLGGQTYNVNRPMYTAPDALVPGLGVVPEKSISTVSLIPSGYTENQSNTWAPSYNVTLVVSLSSFRTSESYSPIIFKFP